METRSDVLRKKYGFNRASYKYIPAGGEILKSIGQVVIFVTRTKDENGEWKADVKKAIIKSINGFDPMTMTYDCHYEVDGEEKTLKIIPEGYSWGNPDETGVAQNFLPYSTHCHLVEDELFYARLNELYDTHDTMSIEEMMTISRSKEKEAILKYTHNIGVVIKLDDRPGEVLYYRLHGLTIRHKVGNQYLLTISDNENSRKLLISSEDKDYNFEGIGRFKIIDLAQ